MGSNSAQHANNASHGRLDLQLISIEFDVSMLLSKILDKNYSTDVHDNMIIH